MDNIKEEIADIISKEEVDTFYVLLKKMNRAYAHIEQLSIENLEKQSQKPVSDEELPYQIVISIVCDVSKGSQGVTIAPEMIENYKKTYVIDVVTNDYNKIIEPLLDEITSKLTEKCSKIIPSLEIPKEQE